METPEWSVVSHLESRLKLSPGSVFPGRVSGLPCAHTLDYPGPRPLIPLAPCHSWQCHLGSQLYLSLLLMCPGTWES